MECGGHRQGFCEKLKKAEGKGSKAIGEEKSQGVESPVEFPNGSAYESGYDRREKE